MNLKQSKIIPRDEVRECWKCLFFVWVVQQQWSCVVRQHPASTGSPFLTSFCWPGLEDNRKPLSSHPFAFTKNRTSSMVNSIVLTIKKICYDIRNISMLLCYLLNYLLCCITLEKTFIRTLEVSCFFSNKHCSISKNEKYKDYRKYQSNTI
jgi:hypothetical protein